MVDELYDLVVVGAGPNGVGAAYHAKQRGLRVLLVDQHSIAHNLSRFPTGLIFFVPGSWMEIGGIPLDSRSVNPTREEAVNYYRRVVELAEIETACNTRFTALEGTVGEFRVHLQDRKGTREIQAKHVVLAAGVYGQPRRLSVPGADLDKVDHGYTDPLDYAGKDVLIVGAGNGAAEAALRLHCEAGANVTVLNRSSEINKQKWRWHFGNLARMMESGAIRVLNDTSLRRIDEHTVTVESPSTGELVLDNDRVLALLGYTPSTTLFDIAGVTYDDDCMPTISPVTLETNRKGVYVAGAMCGGEHPDLIFVVGGRNHIRAIVADILGEPAPIEDKGLREIAHWMQFHDIVEEPSRDMMLSLIPVVTGDFRYDQIDLFTLKNAIQMQESVDEGAPTRDEMFRLGFDLGNPVDDLPGSMMRSTGNGRIVYKGQTLPEDFLTLLRLADGSRTIRDMISEFDEAEDSPFADQVLAVFTRLIGGGRMFWRSKPLFSGKCDSPS